MKLYWCIWEVTLSTEPYNHQFQFMFLSLFYFSQFYAPICYWQMLTPGNRCMFTKWCQDYRFKGIWFDLIIHKWQARFHMIDNIFLFGKMRFQVAIFILFLNFSLLAGLHVPKSLKRTNVFRRLRWIFKICCEKAYSGTFDMLGTILIDLLSSKLFTLEPILFVRSVRKIAC